MHLHIVKIFQISFIADEVLRVRARVYASSKCVVLLEFLSGDTFQNWPLIRKRKRKH